MKIHARHFILLILSIIFFIIYFSPSECYYIDDSTKSIIGNIATGILTALILDVILSYQYDVRNLKLRQLFIRKLSGVLARQSSLLLQIYKGSIKNLPERRIESLEDLFNGDFYDEIVNYNLNHERHGKPLWKEIQEENTYFLFNIKECFMYYGSALNSDEIHALDSIINSSYLYLTTSNVFDYPVGQERYFFSALCSHMIEFIAPFIYLVKLCDKNRDSSLKPLNAVDPEFWEPTYIFAHFPIGEFRNPLSDLE